MTTFIQKHIKNNGKFKTAAGWFATVETIGDNLSGYVTTPTGYNMPCEWHLDGLPINLPTNHGLNLVPLREVITYEVIPVDERV